MKPEVYKPLSVIWDYMHMNMEPEPADCIVGFGNYNDDIALRAAELYHQGFAPKILFTGGLGRNTIDLWTQTEAERFAQIAQSAGVPACDIIIEAKASNTAENILFTRDKLNEFGITVKKILGVHKPFMERRIYAAWKVYWPEMDFIITSPQQSIEEYLEASVKQGLTEEKVIDVLVGDFQRIDVYAKKGYQIPQEIPEAVKEAFREMVSFGYTSELIQ